jgi:dTDP-4-amino-4,6-dideoxygalactose transaminase
MPSSFIKFRKGIWKVLSPPWIDAYVWEKMRLSVISGHWAPGPRTKTVERIVARELGVDPSWVVATRSATVSLEAAYRFLLTDLEKIRVSPLTFASTYSGAINAGIPIEWVDVDDDGWPVSAVDVGVDLHGRPHPRVSDVGAGGPRLLDAAHRVLAPEHGDLVRDGAALVYSFDLRKEVPCLVGGALVHRDLANTYARQWLHFGLGAQRVPIPDLGGTNGGLPDPIAAQAIEALKRRWRGQRKRTRVLEVYEQAFGKHLLTKPGEASGHIAVLRARSEGEARGIRNKLDYHHVEHSCHYQVPEEYGCPNASALAKRLITLPCNTYMTVPSDPLRVVRIVVSA